MPSARGSSIAAPATPFETPSQSSWPPEPQRLDPAPASVYPSRRERPKASAAPVPAPSSTDALELIWFDPEFVSTVREHPPWRHLRPPVEAKPAAREGLGKRASAKDKSEASADSARLDVSYILCAAAPADLSKLDAAVMASRDAAGALRAPLLLAEGLLELGFDEVTELTMAMGIAKHAAPGDRRLAQVIELGDELLKTPLHKAPTVARRLTQQVMEAWSEAVREPVAELRRNVTLYLSRERKYQSRQLLDGSWLCAELQPLEPAGPSAQSTLVYLPEALRLKLPLFRSFSARLIVEALPRQDEEAASHAALRARALARFVSSPPAAPPAPRQPGSTDTRNT